MAAAPNNLSDDHMTSTTIETPSSGCGRHTRAAVQTNPDGVIVSCTSGATHVWPRCAAAVPHANGGSHRCSGYTHGHTPWCASHRNDLNRVPYTPSAPPRTAVVASGQGIGNR